MKNRILIIITAFLISFSAKLYAQQTITIGISKDADTEELNRLDNHLKEEITALLGPGVNVKFKELSANGEIAKVKQNNKLLLEDPTVSILVTLGYLSSLEISKNKSFSKPVIAANILDKGLLDKSITQSDTTGLNNYTYIEPVIQLKNDAVRFAKMFEIHELAVLVPETFIKSIPEITDYLKQSNLQINVSLIPVSNNTASVLSQLPKNTDAAMVLPLEGFSKDEMAKLFHKLNSRHIPTLAVSGVSYLNLGATVTFSPEFTFQRLARQIALRVLKIYEGTNPAKLSVSVNSQRVPIVNMASIRVIGKFPKASFLNESILLNTTKFPTGKKLNIRLAIADALENNLQGKMAKKDIEIAEKNVRIAKSNILPQVSVGGNTVWLSNNLVEASMGQRGAFTLTGSASLKQVIFSESAIANIAINKLMLDNKKFYNDQTVLDIIAKISGSYIGLLFSKSNLLIQNENINATMKNLQLAKAKEKAGQTGISDVNRWVSELNLNKMKFNDAYTTYRTSMYNINQQLNSKIDNTINIPDSVDKSILVNQDILTRIFKNPNLTEKYASFIIEEMKTNSPELQQLQALAEIINRKRKLYKKQWYIPELALVAGAEQAFIRNGTIQPPNMPVPPPPDDMTYNLGISLRIPIFQGGKSSAEAKKSVIETNKIKNQKDELINQLEVGIRTSVQKLRTSYFELELSKNAAKAAEDNYKTVQDAYSRGAANSIQLIDAQNVMTRIKHLANIAYYQYVLDFIQVQRYQGKFIFLSPEEEQMAYTKRLERFLLKKTTN
ncbi:TolC family protein [Candidatus Sulfidibacterium hydrothermale]|uniref:ABC transporter substrate binding protein n=1 Tax=Candidatus Sulfidibacterium hydrothermale TaxID=2875962 RepID=UPI001F0A9D04|nr:ABC transporter substrate binding protein [Candidatus Sulfidibacterium hydrothermale]UBM62709.1 TolC family protein [Candidatus Sulfidibacterium hydrothermale]